MRKTPRWFLLLLVLLPFAVLAQQAAVKYGDNPAAGKYLYTRGIKLYYETYGKGAPLLLIHGNGGSIEHLDRQIPYFEKYYQVIIADSRAQGKTADSGSVLNYQMMTDDLNALLDSLHLDSAFVLGWSDGGINGLLLAITHPDKVKKLAITGANLRPDSTAIAPEGFKMISEALKGLKGATQDAATKNSMKLLHMMEVEPNISFSDLHKISCPVLVIGGDHDVIKPAHTLQIFENIPQAYLWILPASGHATLRMYKDAFNARVHDFFIQPYRKVNWDDWGN